MRAMCTVSIRLMMVLLALLLLWFRCSRFAGLFLSVCGKSHFPDHFHSSSAVWAAVCCVPLAFGPLCVVHVLCAFHSLIRCSFGYDSDVYELQNHDFNCRWKRDARYFLWFVDALHGRFKCFSSDVVAHAAVCLFFFLSVFFSFLPKMFFKRLRLEQQKDFSFEFYATQNPHSKRNTLRGISPLSDAFNTRTQADTHWRNRSTEECVELMCGIFF